jgi:hypothetical protein
MSDHRFLAVVLQSLAVATVIVLGPAAAGAADPKMLAHVVVRDEWMNRMPSPDGRVMEQFRDAGIVLSEAGDPIHETWQTCFGTYATVDGGGERAWGYCDGRNADGDVYWLTWNGDRAKGHWEFIRGTGKFRGIAGGGEWSDKRTPGPGWLIRTMTGEWGLAGR